MDVFDSIAQALSKAVAFVVDWVGYFLSYLLGFLTALVMWLIGLLRNALEVVMYPFVSMIESIMGSWGLDQIGPTISYLFNVSSILNYFADLFQLGLALETALIAYFVKFIIRRIPFFG